QYLSQIQCRLSRVVLLLACTYVVGDSRCPGSLGNLGTRFAFSAEEGVDLWEDRDLHRRAQRAPSGSL
ncbi:MAG TPA: hypothetical protein VGW38_24040, partial [Chloroflexota bacterium]|nr:hypothetical protein [Chloroflexota bacterium]